MVTLACRLNTLLAYEELFNIVPCTKLGPPYAYYTFGYFLQVCIEVVVQKIDPHVSTWNLLLYKIKNLETPYILAPNPFYLTGESSG